MEHFPEEYLAQTKGKTVKVNLVIRSLNSILTERKIILIGGRLQKANISYHEAHPILLPSISGSSDFIIENCGEIKTRHEVSIGNVSTT